MASLNKLLKGQKLVSVKNTTYSCILEVENTTDNTHKEYEIFIYPEDNKKGLLFNKTKSLITISSITQPRDVIDEVIIMTHGRPITKNWYYMIRLSFVNGEYLDFYWETKETCMQDIHNKKFKVSIKQI